MACRLYAEIRGLPALTASAERRSQPHTGGGRIDSQRITLARGEIHGGGRGVGLACPVRISGTLVSTINAVLASHTAVLQTTNREGRHLARMRGRVHLPLGGGRMTDSEQSDITWHKSTASGGQGNCVEVAVMDNAVLVRNSQDPLGSVLSFTCREWVAFLEGVNNGEFRSTRTATTPSDIPRSKLKDPGAARYFICSSNSPCKNSAVPSFPSDMCRSSSKISRYV